MHVDYDWEAAQEYSYDSEDELEEKVLTEPKEVCVFGWCLLLAQANLTSVSLRCDAVLTCY